MKEIIIKIDDTYKYIQVMYDILYNYELGQEKEIILIKNIKQEKEYLLSLYIELEKEIGVKLQIKRDLEEYLKA